MSDGRESTICVRLRTIGNVVEFVRYSPINKELEVCVRHFLRVREVSRHVRRDDKDF
jgi:hypothetical protein